MMYGLIKNWCLKAEKKKKKNTAMSAAILYLAECICDSME